MVRQDTARGIVAAVAMLLAPSGDARHTGQAALSLDDQPQFEREIGPGESQVYQLTLKDAEFVRVSVESRAPQLFVVLQSPKGEPIASRMRSHVDAYAETLSTIAAEAGTLSLRIEAHSPMPGRYMVRTVERRPAVPDDRRRIEAERFYADADRLRTERTPQASREAIAAFERALEIFRALQDDGAVADALNGLGNVGMYVGDYQASIPRLEEALAIRRRLPEPWPRGETLDTLGFAYITRGEMRKALASFQAALREKSLEIPRDFASTLNNLAITYEALGEAEAALAYHRRVRDLARQAGEPIGEGFSLHNIAVLQHNRGYWQEALDHARQALGVWRTIGDARGESATVLLLGMVYEARGEPARALGYYEKALSLRRKGADPRDQAEALWRLGSAYTALGEFGKAIAHQQQALALFRQSGYRAMEAEALLGIGRSHAGNGNAAGALEYYRPALEISRAAESRSGEALVLYATASAQRALGQMSDARASATAAIELHRAVGDRPNEAAALLVRARIDEDTGNLDAARADAEAAIRLIEKQRTILGTPDVRATYLASVGETYEFYVGLLMRLHRTDPAHGFDLLAFRASEQGRARSLADLLIESRSGAADRIERKSLARLRSVRERISAAAERQLQLATRTDGPGAAEITRDLEALYAEHEQIAADIRREDPALASLAAQQPLDVAEFRRSVLDSETVLVEYSLGERRSFMWILSSAGLVSRELPGREQIEAAIRVAHAAVSRPGDATEPLREVSTLILEPAAEWLRSKRIVIVPDGALQYLPFPALPSPATGRPLVADHEIVTLPSASTIALLRGYANSRKSSKVLAVFADPVFDKTDERLRAQAGLAGSTAAQRDPDGDSVESELLRAAGDGGVMRLPRLPFTRREAAAVLSLVPPPLRREALDFNAHRPAVLDPDLASYRFIHFATHGIFNHRHPELSGLVLSMVDERGVERNGFISTGDVLNLSLSADLVVLSACRTGLGKDVRGEGISGLTRAFMYAGAPRVVASMWNVDDAATAELMKRFYEGMLGPRRLAPAAALRAAQLGVRGQARWRAPYYWAAFGIQGEWR